MTIQRTMLSSLSELIWRAEEKTKAKTQDSLIALLVSIEARRWFNRCPLESPFSIFGPGALFLRHSLLQFHKMDANLF